MIAKEPFLPGERRAVLALASLYSFRMLGLFMVLPLLGLYAAELPGATPEMLGIALGAYGLTQASLQLPLGWLSDRIGRRPVILAGLMLFIAGSLVAAAADTINGIILGRFLQGCGAIAAALTALAADYTRESQRTKSMAIVGASVGLSFVIALVLGPVLAALGGLHTVFLVTAGLGTCGLLLVAFVLPKASPVAAEATRGDWEASHIFGGGLPVLYASIFLLHGLLMATFLVVPKLLADKLGFPADHHWALYLGAVLLSVPPALLIMRWSRGDTDPKQPLFAAVSSLLIGAMLSLGGGEFWPVAIGLVFFFAGVNSLEALLPATVSKLAPGALRGTAMGVYSTSQFLGIFAGGAIGGVALGAGGVGGVLLLVTGIAVIWLALLMMLQIRPSIAVSFSE